MPVLKFKQNGEWKEIAGSSSGAETLVVTLSDDGTTASHTAEEIYEYILAKNNVILHLYNDFIPLVRANRVYACFGCTLETGELFFHTIDYTGAYVFRENSYISQEELKVLGDMIGTTSVSEQINTAVAQKSQVQIIKWEDDD